MSEYVSYSTTAMDGASGSVVSEAFKQNGIFFHDVKTWATARQRAEELEKRLAQEMNKFCDNSLMNIDAGNARKEINRLDAMVSAFSKVQPFSALAKAKHGKEFQDIHTVLMHLKKSADHQGGLQEVAATAVHTQNRLERLASNVQQKLCRVEKEVMLDAVSSSLNDIGYLVENRGDVLRATRGQSCIWAKTNPYGELSMDISGFSGLSCMKEIASVEGELKKRGVLLKRSSSYPHGRPEGGALVKKLQPFFPSFKKVEQRRNNVRFVKQTMKQEG